jgi:hypothetical protein
MAPDPSCSAPCPCSASRRAHQARDRGQAAASKVGSSPAEVKLPASSECIVPASCLTAIRGAQQQQPALVSPPAR